MYIQNLEALYIHLGQQTHLDKSVSYWTTPLKLAYYNQPLTNVLLEMQVQASQMQLCWSGRFLLKNIVCLTIVVKAD